MTSPAINVANNSSGPQTTSAVSNATSSACIITPIQRGIELFNNHLTSDPKKKIATTSTSNHQHQPCTLNDLVLWAEEYKSKNIKQCSPARKHIENIITSINQHAQVIDVLIQQQPDITAIVWGAIRLLIGVAAREIDTSQRIGQALVEIVTTLGRWTQFTELFHDFIRVRDIASHLFSQIINFLVRARIYFQKPRTLRHVKIGFTTWTQKLEAVMSLIQKYSNDLDHEGTLASEIKHAEFRKVQEQEFEVIRRKQEELGNDSSNQANVTNSIIREVAQTLEQFTTSQDTLRVITWLQEWSSSPPLIASPEKGTFMWIQQSEQWQTWTDSQYQKPLCISGLPGSGKTTLANYLASTATTSITVAYFFQGVANKDTAKPVALAAHVLGKLLDFAEIKRTGEHKLAVTQILELSKSKKRVCDIRFQTLWTILLGLLKAISKFTIIVDGLDECDEDSTNELSSELIKMASDPNTRVVVLFRHHSILETTFKDSVLLELTPAEVSKDILTHVNAEIRRHPKQLKPVEKEIIQAVSNSAQGIFVWITMMLECLKSALSLNEQRTYLESPPRLFQFYEKIVSHKLEQIPSSYLRCRRDILVIIFGAYRPLSCYELSAVLALKADGKTQLVESDLLVDPEKTVLRLCGPLVRVTKHRVHFMHSTVKEYLMTPSTYTIYHSHITSDESETYLALKCLAALSQEEYRSPNKIAILIRQNVASVAAEEEEDKYFYQYAATHWVFHLVAVKAPKSTLVHATVSFLEGNQFVCWSEFIFQISGSQGFILETESKLKLWQKDRLDDSTGYLPLDGYFSDPYRTAADYFAQEGGDKTLPYLCLFQLGAYFNLLARRDEAFNIKQMVAEGLIELLGERNPLSLMAESAFALEFVTQGRFPEAEEIFVKLAQIQKEVLGTERPDTFQSLQRAGMAELWMTKFAEADMNLTESLAGFFNTVGVKSYLYLMSQLTLGQVLEYQGEIKRAILDYEHIWRYRVSILGPDNPMAVWARCAMVSAYRKLGRYEEADVAVGEVIDSRTRTIGRRSPPTIDAVIQRLVLYLDSEKIEEAMELIDFILDGNLVDDSFERTVQVEHVRALLESLADRIESAIEILQSLLDDASKLGETGRNRSILWVRLDLATILRGQGRNDETLMLFDDIATYIDTDSISSWEEPEAPNKLIITEMALRLVRELKPQEADMLLKKNCLRWVRQEDFWILNGSPAADTGWMKSPEVKEASNEKLLLYVVSPNTTSLAPHPSI